MSLACSNELYLSLKRIRMVEEAIAERYAEQKMRCPVHLSIGHEAIAVGVCHHLRKSDFVLSNHRAHAHYLAKGGSLKKMVAEMYGKESGCARGRGGSMHLVDLAVGFLGSTPVVGGSIPIGVGAAFATKLRGEESLTAIFFGEGATEEGVFSESLNFAALKALPVLFVCENNLYSVNTPLSERQSPKRSQVQIAEGHGLLALKGEGNSLEEVVRIAKQAVEHIRGGQGPVFVEFTTFRYREHCGPHMEAYFPQDEYQKWLERDPLRGFEGSFEAIQTEIEEAFHFAERSSFPTYA